MERKRKTMLLDAALLRRIFPELNSQADCVLATLVAAVAGAFLKEILEPKNFFLVTDSRKESDFAILLIFGGEFIDCYFRKESISSTGKYPLSITSALAFQGSEEVVPLVFERLELDVRNRGLDYWKSLARQSLDEVELKVLHCEIVVFYEMGK